MKFISIILLGLNALTYGQTVIHHQALSSQGLGVKLSNGMYINQTIGQQNVIGNYSKNGHTYGQGYQQGYRKKGINKSSFPVITTISYPNPFINTIHFQFSKPIEDIITVRVLDGQGRLVFQQQKKSYDSILTIELERLPASNYIVQLSTFNYTYSTKILKQQ